MHDKTKRDGMPAVELRDEGMHGSGSSTEHFYKVEVRTSYYAPTVIGGDEKSFVIDHCWRELPIYLGSTPWGQNVPIRSHDTHACEHGMVSHTAAEAHRWAFLAWLEANRITGTLCIETRLVKVEIKRSYQTKELGVSAAQVAHDHRESDFAPRTAKPAQAAAA